MRSVVAALALALAAHVTGCEASSYEVLVVFEPRSLADDVVRVEVALVGDCDAQPPDGGEPSGAVREIAITRAGAIGRIGSVPEGAYGLYARGRTAGCQVIAVGCRAVTLEEGGSGRFVVTVEAEDEGPRCGLLDRCVEGACVPGEPDAGLDGGADAGRDASIDARVLDAACTPACAGGTETACVGGGTVTRVCPAGCHASEPRCARVDPSNVPVSLLDASAASVSIDSRTMWSTDTCDAAPTMTVATAPDGSETCVVRTGTLEVNGVLRVVGSRPLVVLAEGSVHIRSTIDLAAYGVEPGAGGFDGSAARGGAAGPQPGEDGMHVEPLEDGGGGGGGACGTGGAGGAAGVATGGIGGASVEASWVLEPLRGGSGGGRGGGNRSDDDTGNGGAGGGALQITSQVAIDVSGRIAAAGGGGNGGGAPASGNRGAGGGGGAGGSVLLEAPEILFSATGAIVASGGGGGGGSGGGIPGGDGEDGVSAAARAAGGSAGDADSGEGGAGGGGATLDGATGEIVAAPNNAGGGGGAAGCILIRTRDGTLPAGATRSSPSTGLGLRASTIATR